VGGDAVVYVERSHRGNWEDKQRRRSCPQSARFFGAACCFLILWLSVAALITSLVMITMGYHEPWTALCLWATAAAIGSFTASLITSLNAKCPLCLGTPLHSRHGCRKHRLADRWPLLTRRATVILRIVTALSFRCMYCGTPFRLFKKSSQRRE
jgi:hypothetical protein